MAINFYPFSRYDLGSVGIIVLSNLILILEKCNYLISDMLMYFKKYLQLSWKFYPHQYETKLSSVCMYVFMTGRGVCVF